MKRRVGKFKIAEMFIEKQPKVVKEIMGQCIIIRAEMMWYGREIEYVALCDLFDEIEEGMLLPTYIWTYSTKGWIVAKVDQS